MMDVGLSRVYRHFIYCEEIGNAEMLIMVVSFIL